MKSPSKKGRPTKYNPNTVRVICDAVATGVPFRHAAAVGGISQDTFHEWRRTIPAFSESIERAVAKGIQSRLFLIQTAANGGDVRAAQWWLEHVFPEHFAKSPVEVSHQGSIEHQFAISPALLDEIARVRAKYDQTSRN